MAKQRNNGRRDRRNRRDTRQYTSAPLPGHDNSNYTDAAESLDASSAAGGHLPEVSSTAPDSSVLDSPSDLSLMANAGGSVATNGGDEGDNIQHDSTDEISTEQDAEASVATNCGVEGDHILHDATDEIEISAEHDAEASVATNCGNGCDDIQLDATGEIIAAHPADDMQVVISNEVSPVQHKRSTVAPNGENAQAQSCDDVSITPQAIPAKTIAAAPPRSVGRSGQIPAVKGPDVGRGGISFGRGREDSQYNHYNSSVSPQQRAAISHHAKDVGQKNLFVPTTSSEVQEFSMPQRSVAAQGSHLQDSFPMGNTFGSSYQTFTQSSQGYLPSQLNTPSAWNSHYFNHNNGAQQQTSLDSLFYPGQSENEMQARAHLMAETITNRFGGLLIRSQDGGTSLLQVHGVYHSHFARFLQQHRGPIIPQGLVVGSSFSRGSQTYGYIPSREAFIDENGVSPSFHGNINWSTLMTQRHLMPLDSYMPVLVTEVLHKVRQGQHGPSPYHQSREGSSHFHQIGTSSYHPNQEGFYHSRQEQHGPSFYHQTPEGSSHFPQPDYDNDFNHMSGEVMSFHSRAPREFNGYAPRVESTVKRGYDSARRGASHGDGDDPSLGSSKSFGKASRNFMYSRGNGGGGGNPPGAPGGVRNDDRRPDLKEPKSMSLKIPAYDGACEVIRFTGEAEENQCTKLPVLWIREFDRLFSLSGINSAFQGICALMHLSLCLQGQYQTDIGHVNRNPHDGAAWGYTEIIQAICQRSEDPRLDAYQFDRLAQWLIITFTATEMKVRQYEELRYIRQASRTVLQHNIRFRHAHFVFWHLNQRTDWRAQVPIATPEICEIYKESLKPEIREGVISSIHNAHTTRAIQNAFQDALEIGEQGAPGQINRTTILARPADMPLPDLMILAEAIERGLTETRIQVRRQITRPPSPFRGITRRPSPPLRQITNGSVGAARFNNLEEVVDVDIDAEEEVVTEECDDEIDSLGADALYNKAVRENRVIWTRGQLQRLLREGRCLKCGQKGHRASLCSNSPANPANFQFNNLQEIDELQDDEFLLNHLRDVCGASPVLSNDHLPKNGVPHHSRH